MNNSKKQITAILTSALLLCLLTGCKDKTIGGGQGDDSSQSDVSQSSSDSTYTENEQILSRVQLKSIASSSDDFVISENDNIECKNISIIQLTNPDAFVSDIYSDNDGTVIKVSDYPNCHFVWLDDKGNVTDKTGFDYCTQKEIIPDKQYPNGNAFRVSDESCNEVRFYKHGKLVNCAELPKCYRGDFTDDYTQYVFISENQSTMSLYDLYAQRAVYTLSAEDFGLDNTWKFEFIKIASADYAVVTFLAADESAAGEYHGSEKLASFIFSLPVFKVVQQLPDGSDLIEISDGKFMLTKQEGQNRRICSAEIVDGKIVEKETDLLIHDSYQTANCRNIEFSPDKKIALIREWEINIDNAEAYLVCKVVYTDNMQEIWNCRLKPDEENGLMAGMYTISAVTNNGVAYIVGGAADNEKCIYKISEK